MKFIVTTSRMPYAIDLIRKLGRRGHDVVATDTFRSAPGNHSRYATKSRTTVAPREQPLRFVGEVARIIEEERVDWLIPAFEEAFYLAHHRELLPECELFFPELELLEKLHDKSRLNTLAKEVGIVVPETIVVKSRDDLEAATREIGDFFAKPAFSRGGVDLFTNVGPLAGVRHLDDCDVSEDQPWVVQEFIEGLDLCTFSVVHHGKITGHSSYVHPRQIEHAGGIVFESIEDSVALGIARALAEHTGYHGHMSLDLMRSAKGHVLIECNPRPTAGLHVMSEEMYEAALLDREGSELRVAPAGVKCKYSVALLRNLLLHFDDGLEDVKYLVSNAREVVADPTDIMPAICQVLSYGHVMAYKKRAKKLRNTDLKAAYFADVCWNGSEGAPMSAR